jgi:hypothetical protein
VQIIELKPGHLDRAHTQPREQHHDREVARADQLRAVARRQQPADIGAIKPHRNASVSPTGHRRHRIRQAGARQAADMQKAQQRSQLDDATLDRPHAQARRLPRQEPRHNRAGETRHPQHVLRRASLAKEPPRQRLPANHRRRRQPPLEQQPHAVVGEQLLKRRTRRRGPLGDDPLSSQILEQRHEPPGARHVPITLGAARSEKQLDRADIELRDLHTLPRDPSRHLPQLGQLAPHRTRRIAKLKQPGAIAVHERAETTRPANTRHLHRLLVEARGSDDRSG